MTNSFRHRGSIVLAVMLVLAVFVVRPAQAQTFTVLYNFTGGSGRNPWAGLIQDANGNLYGTTMDGGSCGYGVVFKLDKSGHETVLHSFCGGASDGAFPFAGLLGDANGNLYGTTEDGGDTSCHPDWGCGVVFRLNASGKISVLHSFTGSPDDGAFPLGGLIQDKKGNLYGVTDNGGSGEYCPSYGYFGCGTVFKVDTGGNETVLHNFAQSSSDGANPYYTTLLMDKRGTLYGITNIGGSGGCGGAGCGVVYKLTANGTMTVLHAFAGGTTDGCYPFGALAMDKKYNLYGTASTCGSSNLGMVWKVAALVNTRGAETVLYNFAGTDGNAPEDVILDAKGNLYGETIYGGDLSCNYPTGCGTLYELSSNSKLIQLHTFDGVDGEQPLGGLLLDEKGNFYGTAEVGGSDGYGTVWKYVP
jgi:uncharacterized repeat protein (TIGR03803 family)